MEKMLVLIKNVEKCWKFTVKCIENVENLLQNIKKCRKMLKNVECWKYLRKCWNVEKCWSEN